MTREEGNPLALAPDTFVGFGPTKYTLGPTCYLSIVLSESLKAVQSCREASLAFCL